MPGIVEYFEIHLVFLMDAMFEMRDGEPVQGSILQSQLAVGAIELRDLGRVEIFSCR